MKIHTLDIQKIAQREAFSKYIYPPLKRSFLPTVRIISLVLVAARKFKEGLIRRRAKAGKAEISDIDELKPKTVRFTIFEVTNSTGSNEVKDSQFR